ncbi:MAG: hypothetical protein AAF756_17860 [Pseudomonadota bacterium]
MTDASAKVTDWLSKEISRHRLWRQIWSVSYFAVAASTVIAGALTTASAGIFENASTEQTTWLAAVTTILASLEKVLRLREKWDLHREVHASLELIDIRYGSDLIDTEEAVKQLDEVARRYSNQLAALTSTKGSK